MEITRDGAAWGTMEIKEHGTQVQFHASGTLPRYGEILRVWGMREGCQPLLIGVAEPDGAGLVIDRTMSRQYLSSLGYDALPDFYTAGTQPPKAGQQHICDPLIEQAMTREGITMQTQENMLRLSCSFTGDAAFPLAFIFACCTVKDGIATVIWDRKKGLPLCGQP